MDAIENKVAKSGLITLDLSEMKPSWEVVGLDIAPLLVEGLMLREKDFRAFIAENNWASYKGQHVYIFCSTDAIVPTWAYMLIGTKLSGVASSCSFGSRSDLMKELWQRLVDDLDLSIYRDKRVIVKGCSDEKIDESIYVNLSTRLTPVVKTLMFGEPCSTVPLYKKKDTQ